MFICTYTHNAFMYFYVTHLLMLMWLILVRFFMGFRSIAVPIKKHQFWSDCILHFSTMWLCRSKFSNNLRCIHYIQQKGYQIAIAFGGSTWTWCFHTTDYRINTSLPAFGLGASPAQHTGQRRTPLGRRLPIRVDTQASFIGCCFLDEILYCSNGQFQVLNIF